MGKFGTLRKKTGVRSSGTFWRLSLWFGSMGFSCRGFPPPAEKNRPKKNVQLHTKPVKLELCISGNQSGSERPWMGCHRQDKALRPLIDERPLHPIRARGPAPPSKWPAPPPPATHWPERGFLSFGTACNCRRAYFATISTGARSWGVLREVKIKKNQVLRAKIFSVHFWGST